MIYRRDEDGSVQRITGYLQLTGDWTPIAEVLKPKDTWQQDLDKLISDGIVEQKGDMVRLKTARRVK